jgi:hypothetical protein
LADTIINSRYLQKKYIIPLSTKKKPVTQKLQAPVNIVEGMAILS